MQSKVVRIFRPFHFLILACLIITVMLLWIIRKGLGVYNFTILLLCISYITNWEVVRVFKGKCEFYKNFLFIKYGKHSIEIAELDELFLIQNDDAIGWQSSAALGASSRSVILKNFLLVAKNHHKQLLFILKSMHYNNVLKIGKLFSEYYNIPILKKIYFGDLTEKKFVGGDIINDLIEEKRLNDYKKWRDKSFPR